ncbi:MAG: preprotein translocase subunit SecG [Tissierellia bacterium]|nr:preprotein translocase subunit SecG [Tissierellia bacterium]
MATFFTAVFLISSISLIISVLLQDDKSEGLGVLTGDKDSFFGNAKSRSKDYILNRITTISAIVFMISALVLVAI